MRKRGAQIREEHAAVEGQLDKINPNWREDRPDGKPRTRGSCEQCGRSINNDGKPKLCSECACEHCGGPISPELKKARAEYIADLKKRADELCPKETQQKLTKLCSQCAGQLIEQQRAQRRAEDPQEQSPSEPEPWCNFPRQFAGVLRALADDLEKANRELQLALDLALKPALKPAPNKTFL